MIDALHIATSGLRSEQRHIDVISNNVANMQTPGFKKSRANFVEVASGASDVVRSASSHEHRSGGTRISSTSIVFSTGEFRPTQNALDLAIDGNGFFEVELENGDLAYTRDGQLKVNDEGFLTTGQGFKLTKGIQITPDATDIRIAENGELTAKFQGESERFSLGILELATFPSQEGLVSIGENRYTASEDTGAPTYGRPGDVGFGTVMQRFVELSNVNVVDEMSSLVMAQRAYQLNARVLQASDQILETINNLRR